MSNINELVCDTLFGDNIISENSESLGKTPSELEQESMSHINGTMFYYEDSKESAFLFKVDESTYLEMYFPKKPYEMTESEEIDGTIENRRLRMNPKLSFGSFVGGGSLTVGHGIDFTFETTLFDGKYNLREMSGIGTNIKLTRV